MGVHRTIWTLHLSDTAKCATEGRVLEAGCHQACMPWTVCRTLEQTGYNALLVLQARQQALPAHCNKLCVWQQRPQVGMGADLPAAAVQSGQ